jgi:hypothetical protein
MEVRAFVRPFFDAEREEIIMHQTMFPLLIIDILENHATKDRPLSISQITEFVNKEFAPFVMDKEKMMNRSTVMRILEAITFWTEEGNLLNFRVVQCGTYNKKLFCLEK